MVVCGLPLVAEVFRSVDPSLEIQIETEDGKTVSADTTLLRIHGCVRSIMSGERLALNFLGRLAGVATYTRSYVDAVAGSGAAIVDTRKTLPGWRLLDKYAVLAGGGTNHRIGLFDGILLKDNHIAAAGGVGLAVEQAKKNAPPGMLVQCEVESLEHALEAYAAGADMLLLDNQTPDELRAIAAACPDGLVLEASGGITLDNVCEISTTGVQRISIGALTHSAPVVDVALEMESGASDGRG
jgi:nicotinate-nucleotide pyrophosphorylase (carboxylating)